MDTQFKHILIILYLLVFITYCISEEDWRRALKERRNRDNGGKDNNNNDNNGNDNKNNKGRKKKLQNSKQLKAGIYIPPGITKVWAENLLLKTYETTEPTGEIFDMPAITRIISVEVRLDEEWWTKQLSRKCLESDYIPDGGSGDLNNNAPETHVFDLTDTGGQGLTDDDPLGYGLRMNETWSSEQKVAKGGDGATPRKDNTGTDSKDQEDKEDKEDDDEEEEDDDEFEEDPEDEDEKEVVVKETNEETVARKFFEDPLELASNDDLCQPIGVNLVVDSRKNWMTSKRWKCSYGKKPKPKSWYKTKTTVKKLANWNAAYVMDPGFEIAVDKDDVFYEALKSSDTIWASVKSKLFDANKIRASTASTSNRKAMIPQFAYCRLDVKKRDNNIENTKFSFQVADETEDIKEENTAKKGKKRKKKSKKSRKGKSDDQVAKTKGKEKRKKKKSKKKGGKKGKVVQEGNGAPEDRIPVVEATPKGKSKNKKKAKNKDKKKARRQAKKAKKAVN